MGDLAISCFNKRQSRVGWFDGSNPWVYFSPAFFFPAPFVILIDFVWSPLRTTQNVHHIWGTMRSGTVSNNRAPYFAGHMGFDIPIF